MKQLTLFGVSPQNNKKKQHETDRVIQRQLSEFQGVRNTARAAHIWIAWIEKQGESYTKKDVDDAWLKGICDAKRELEKQREQRLKSLPQK